jgi:hypothetical protein
MRDTDLISRCLGSQILSAADKDSVSLNEIWSAMRESVLLDEYLLFTEFRLSRDSSFSVAMMRYIREQNDSTNKVTIFAVIGSECRWDELAVGISNDKLRRNVQWLADWIEADIAYAAFVCSRMNRKIFSGNRIRNWSALTMSYLRTTPSMTEKSQKNRWHDELDEIAVFSRQDFPDRLKEVTDGVRSADSLKPGPTPLEKWLFRIWPLVIHHCWTKREIKACAGATWPVGIDEARDVDYFLRCRGLRGGAPDGGRGVPRNREGPPKQALALSWLTAP